MTRVSTKILVRVNPNADKSELMGVSKKVWHFRVSAPPVKGKANQELLSLISRLLNVSKGRVSISKGHTSRNKVIAISGLSQEEIIKRLSSG